MNNQFNDENLEDAKKAVELIQTIERRSIYDTSLISTSRSSSKMSEDVEECKQLVKSSAGPISKIIAFILEPTIFEWIRKVKLLGSTYQLTFLIKKTEAND